MIKLMCTMQVARVEAGPDSCTPECSQVDCPCNQSRGTRTVEGMGKESISGLHTLPPHWTMRERSPGMHCAEQSKQ